MSTAKHTPGPWVPYNSDKGRIFSHWYIRVDSGPTIVTVHNGLPDNQDMGNAALIAAAPAMYEALKALVEVFPSVVKMTPYGVTMDISKIHDDAKAALAQAEARS